MADTTKYLLSTGKTTRRPEEYIIDLFKLHMKIYPGDVPGVYDFGYDFNQAGIYKSELPQTLRRSVENLVSKINSRFQRGVTLELISLEIMDETKAKVVVSAGNISDEITINIYN